MHLTERDHSIIKSIARYSLTSRLILEISKTYPKPFNQIQAVYRRMKQLEEAGLVNKRKMFFSGENYYYLTKRAGELILHEDERRRSTNKIFSPIKEVQQQHEYLISQFMIRFEQDCQKLKVPVEFFIREGQFIAWANREGELKKIVPDGTIVLRIKDKYRVFFLEIDRSTERIRTSSKINTNSFQEKIRRYTDFFQDIRNHELLKELIIKSFRVITVCITPERMENLRQAAQEMKKQKTFCFTYAGKFIEKREGEWSYKKANILRSPIFFYPDKAEPRTIFEK